MIVGYVDIVKTLMQAAGSPEKLKNMLETTDIDGDTVRVVWKLFI